jgi:hypothetical protein
MPIVIKYDPKPIPNREFDWSATPENYEPGSPVGFGRTEQEAVDDLLDQLEEIDNERGR